MKLIFRIILLIAIMAGLVFGYYRLMQRFASIQDEPIVSEQMQQWQQAAERGEQILARGRLTRSDGVYFLSFEDRSKVEVRGGSLALSSFIGKEVEVAGELRGEMLMISKVQEIK